MNNEVKVLKLTTGEEIITRMTEEDSGNLLLEKPMVIQQMAPDTTGRVGIGLVPWSFAGNTDSVTIESKYVLVTLESTSEMGKNYLSTITGISL